MFEKQSSDSNKQGNCVSYLLLYNKCHLTVSVHVPKWVLERRTGS